MRIVVALLVLTGCALPSTEPPSFVGDESSSLSLVQYSETDVLWDARAQTFPPSAGTRFVLSSVRVSNLGEDDLAASPDTFELSTTSGRPVAPSPRLREVVGACGDRARVPPQQTLECGLVFEVALEETPGELVHTRADLEPLSVRYADAPKGPAPLPPRRCDAQEAEAECSAGCIQACTTSCDCLASPACSAEQVYCLDALTRAFDACGC